MLFDFKLELEAGITKFGDRSLGSKQPILLMAPLMFVVFPNKEAVG